MTSQKKTQSHVTVFPAAPGAKTSDIYSVVVNGQPVLTERFAEVHHAHFAFSGECEVQVRLKPTIGSKKNLRFIYTYRISPKRHGIASTSELDTVTFRLDRPRNLAIRLDDREWLFLFASAEDENTPQPGDANVVNLADYVSDAEGKDLQTGAIAKAVEAVPENGTLLVPPGLYRTGTIRLKSNMTLHVAGGAVLSASDDPEDFPSFEKSEHWHASEGYWISRQFLLIGEAENVHVTGHGLLDANGRCLRAQGHGPHHTMVVESRNVTIENVTLRNAAAWCLHILKSENVTARNVRMMHDWDVLNTDAVDPDCSNNVVVEDCFAYTSDDGIVVKCTVDGHGARDIMVRRNVLVCKKSALKIGTESRGEIANVVFEDNDVVLCDRGMNISCEDGFTIRDTKFIGYRFEEPYMDSRRRLIDMYTWDRNGGGTIENTLIKNCTADVRWPHDSTLFAACGPIRGLHFENMAVEGTVCRNVKDLGLHIDIQPCNDARRPTVCDITFEPDDGVGWNPALL